jgi:hypothetical protein
MDTTSKTDNPAEPEAQPAEQATTQEATAKDATQDGVLDAIANSEQVNEDEDAADEVHENPDGDNFYGAAAMPTATPSGVLSGAASVVGAGLGLASLSGTWFSTLIANHQQLIAQIKAQSGSSANPVADVYSGPWHTTALINGVFALVAGLVAIAVLLRARLSSGVLAASWIKPVAWGALVLGAIGLLIAGTVWFDLFTTLPAIHPRTG